jgi:hypothetical protein
MSAAGHPAPPDKGSVRSNRLLLAYFRQAWDPR